MTMRIRKKPHKHPRATTAHLDRLLDEALRETFPASDPVAIAIDIGFSRHRTADAPMRRGRKPGRYRPSDP
ncbi:hypothetical protein [Enhydrobacter sp.]|jgi:hypothetical protein|uniref:hypothetical protein n=1 Tax=Enhydrobacter sp. TaxID=1894999 RepID=UPI002632D484|nr:hypothetical protein [Enhydrobacter sp.]WIM11940.1 MAG: hypothetical protein OJF58_002900 [Enhydrobacter sp.]